MSYGVNSCRVYNLEKSMHLVRRFETAVFFALITLLLHIIMLSLLFYFACGLFHSFMDCLFLAVLISSVDGTSIDESIT